MAEAEGLAASKIDGELRGAECLGAGGQRGRGRSRCDRRYFAADCALRPMVTGDHHDPLWQ